MNKEELKLLEKIVNLPKELNIEIRGLILAEVVLREENQQLKKQLQQKEDIINKAKEYIKLKLNTKNKDVFPFLLFKRTHVEKILEVLDNKGE